MRRRGQDHRHHAARSRRHKADDARRPSRADAAGLLGPGRADLARRGGIGHAHPTCAGPHGDRPSNNVGGVEHLARLLRNVPADRSIIVVGEWDEKTDGSWPGGMGAKSTAARLSAAGPTRLVDASSGQSEGRASLGRREDQGSGGRRRVGRLRAIVSRRLRNPGDAGGRRVPSRRRRSGPIRTVPAGGASRADSQLRRRGGRGDPLRSVVRGVADGLNAGRRNRQLAARHRQAWLDRTCDHLDRDYRRKRHDEESRPRPGRRLPKSQAGSSPQTVRDCLRAVPAGDGPPQARPRRLERESGSAPTGRTADAGPRKGTSR